MSVCVYNCNIDFSSIYPEFLPVIKCVAKHFPWNSLKIVRYKLNKIHLLRYAKFCKCFTKWIKVHCMIHDTMNTVVNNYKTVKV